MQRERSAQRARRLVALVLGSAVVVVVLLLTAFSGGSAPAQVSTIAPMPPELVVSRPPTPQVVAIHGSLRLQLPISQAEVTAIGYHDAGNGALPLEPVGVQGNRGLVRRVVDRLLGTEPDGVVWYRLQGARPDTALDVGAPAGADVFAPTDGTVVGITPFVLNGERYGARIDIRPVNSPSLTVSMTRLAPDPALAVGDPVVAATTRMGTVLDLATVEQQALARYTHDGGNHVTLEVRAAATLSLP